MQLKKVTQKDKDGNSVTYEFNVPPKQEIPKYDHPGGPKGTDTVPAWLTPGEFVMNAEATRMYKPQIEAMNNQGKAVQAAQGGTIPEYKFDGGQIMDFFSSLFGGDVPEKAVQASQEAQVPPDVIPKDYNVRPLDLPPESPMAVPKESVPAVPTPAEPNSYLANMTQAESSGRADAKNPNSSATGLHQFTAPTWLSVAKTYEPELYNSMSEEELLALRTNPEVSTRMATHLTNENKRILERKDIATTNDNLYLLHFGGPSSGVKAITAPADTKAEDIFTEGQMKANPFLKGMTAGEIRAWSKGKVGGDSQASVTEESAGVPQIFSNAVASDKPSGDYFPSDVPPMSFVGDGDPEDIHDDKNWYKPEEYIKRIQEATSPEEAQAIAQEMAQRSREAQAADGYLENTQYGNNVPMQDTGRGIEAAPVPAAEEVPEPEGVPVNAYAEALKEQRAVSENLNKQRETIADAEFIGAREDDIKETQSDINSVDADIAELEAMKVVAESQGLETQSHDAQIAALEKEKAGLQSTLATTKEDKAQAEEEVKQKNLNLEGTTYTEDAPLREQRKSEVANEIVKATDSLVTEEDFANAQRLEEDLKSGKLENAAMQAPEGAMDKVMDFFEEYGITDLFDKKELGKMAVMYLGSRLLGHSHGGSLNFAAKNYISGVSTKQATKAKNVQKLLEDGKFTPASIARYEKSGNVEDLVKKGLVFTPTGETQTIVYMNPKTKKKTRIKVRKVKGSDGGFYHQANDGTIINPLSSNVQDYKPEMWEGTPEYNTYSLEAEKAALDSFKSVANVEGNMNDDGELIVPIAPDKAARQFVSWARTMGLDPKDPKVRAMIGDAYTQAIRENKGKELKATELEPYLTRMTIMQKEGRVDLYERKDSDGKGTGTYISPVDLAQLRSKVEEETNEIMSRRSTPVTTKQIMDYAASRWESLGPEGQQKYHDAALDGRSSGFAKFFEEQLDANKFDRITK